MCTYCWKLKHDFHNGDFILFLDLPALLNETGSFVGFGSAEMALRVQWVCLEDTCLILYNGDSVRGKKTTAPALRSGLSQRSFLFSFPYYLSVKGKAGGKCSCSSWAFSMNLIVLNTVRPQSSGTKESEV